MKGKTICIAVDGSPAANAAIEKGLELAFALDSSVWFIHADSPLAEDLYQGRSEDPPGPDEILSADPILAAASARAKDAGVEATVELIATDHHTGDFAAALAGIAEGVDAALLVCGSRGRTASTGAVLGSVSHNLIALSKVPVVIVHAPI